MTVKPWREIAIPHEDVLRGTFQQAEFAADISRVHAGTATEEYQDPKLFYQRTFITEGMRLLLDSVLKRLAGRGGDPVIQLQTAFGGGKTHTMLAVYHLVGGKARAQDLPGVSSILDACGITELPKAIIAVLDGIKSSPNQPQQKDGIQIRTLWGDLAWQLGKADGYALVADADASGTSPGKEVLEALLSRFSPCVILIDELVAYIRQFEEGKSLTGGTFDSNLSFIQALTEALKAVPTAVLLASLPESEKEAGSSRGVKALEALSHYFGRIQALWRPVATEEAFEIVRRRLFSSVADRLAAESVCRSFIDFYTANRDEFPQDTQESRYYERMIKAYPIHPEVFDRLYDDWSTLDNFQRTRGVLKMMAKVIHRLWKDGNNDPLIMPGSLPLYDADTINEVLYYLPQGWNPVIDKDVDGERAETTEIETDDTRFGSVQACRRSARTIFLGSAPSSSNEMARGIDLEHVILGSAIPGQQVSLFKDAIRRLQDKLHYLNIGNNRFWFDTRPNLRREMEDRKRRFQEKEDLLPEIRDRLQKSFAGGVFSAVHVFTPGADIPDDWSLRLVVLPPEAGFSRSAQNLAIEYANGILKKRGEQPRFKQNRLIFLAADYDTLLRLRDQVRSALAWQSIVTDIKSLRLNLDQFQAKQAEKSLADANDALRRMIRETYKWVLAPMQDVRPGKGPSDVEWESFQINPGTPNLTQEIEKVLKENELLITEWAPIHLASLLKAWYWKDGVNEVNGLTVWQQSCQHLYMPRLLNDGVFRNTIEAGAGSRDFFGLAQGREDEKYIGFTFGSRTSIFLDSGLLLIEPSKATSYAESIKPKPIEPTPGTGGEPPSSPPQGSGTSGPTSGGLGGETKTVKKNFYASVELDPIQAKRQFAELVDEVLEQFTSRAGVRVRLSIDIEAESSSGFDDGLQRSVKENCKVLRFKTADFEEGE
jgi:uncharacterized protein